MATKFGRVEHSGNLFEEQTFYKNQTITSASDGVNHHFGLKDDMTKPDDPTIGVLTESGSQWAFVHNMFYMSGSTKIAQENSEEVDKYNSLFHKFNQHNDLKPFHNNKFHNIEMYGLTKDEFNGINIKPKNKIFTFLQKR